MTIELPKEARKAAIESIERYFREHMDLRVLAELDQYAGGRLD